jgi:hypothetical protein
MTAARLITVVTVRYQSLIAVTTTRKLGTILWSSYLLIYKTLSCRAIYLSALKSYQKILSYTVVVPYSRVLSYIPIYSVSLNTRNNSRPKRSYYGCLACDVALCKEGPCFEQYHEKYVNYADLDQSIDVQYNNL